MKIPRHDYFDLRARRLAGHSRVALGMALVTGAFLVMGIAGSGGTFTPIHGVITTVVGVFALLAVVTFSAARWMDREMPVLPTPKATRPPQPPKPPREFAPVPTAPLPIVTPAVVVIPVAVQLAIEAPTRPAIVIVHEEVEQPETVPVA